MADMVLIVSYFSVLLGSGVIAANIMKKGRVPDTFVLLAIGLLAGPTLWKYPPIANHIDFMIVDVSAMSVVPDFLRTLALVLIVFTGAFSLDLEEMKRFADYSVSLAFSLVLLNTIFIGIAAKLIFGFQWLHAFLIGAIISGTDASVIFTFEEPLKKYSNVLTVLKVESILNSPLSVLLPLLILDLIGIAPTSVFAPGKYLNQFLLMIVAGIGSGVVIGLAISKLVKSMLKEYSSLLIISLALLTFGLSEAVGGSGMLGVAVAGFVIGNMGFPNKKKVQEFQSEFADMLRISVFTLLGAQILLNLNPLLLLTEFLFALLIFVIRPVFVSYLARDIEEEEGFEGFSLLKLSAPRGISAAAMAPIAAVAVGNNMIMDIVFMVIFFTVLFSTITANLISTGEIVEYYERYVSLRNRITGKVVQEAPTTTTNGALLKDRFETIKNRLDSESESIED